MALMNYDEYKKGHYEWPYTYKIKVGDSVVYYFGEAHSFDPEHPEWKEMKKLWQEFLKVTEGKKRVVCIEGGLGHRQGATTEKEAILNGGGMGLSEHDAEEAGIEVFTGEPPVEYERDELLKHFTRDEVEHNYFVRQAEQWTKMLEPKEAFDVYMRRFLEWEKKKSGRDDYDYSLENALAVHKKMYGKDLDLTDTNFLYDLNNPVDLKTPNSHVSRVESAIRDEYCVNKIVEYVRKGYSVFVHYGGSHAIIQEPSLRQLLESN